ncbi:(2Fe-2S)-binding protein [Breznakiella homolactica]|uniref:4Fe-4S binding protein n=1 Tax=Breznakiella homolactica TaxID=2798577 RepID=A0A7T7XR53_9SPIR|nr:(2Fe-2S)-binding protein [Breznakiella homolactica]QQO10943.1 4Fe-4S binding protein [Breznakiella homolactica]
MKKVTLLAQVDSDQCRGCKICEKVCPVLAVKVTDKKAKVEAQACRGCTNCESRCPFHAIKMVKRDEPFTVGVDVSKFPAAEIKALCDKAHFNVEQVLCYCTAVRADEVAAAILGGAKTPEEISSQTGIRTGCSIECMQTILRLMEAAGLKHEPIAGGWQLYGKTITAWELTPELKKKYSSRGFYFDEDKALLDRVVSTNTKEGN